MPNLGAFEIVLIALVAIVLFGGKRIAEVGKGLGQGIRNFKEGIKEEDGKTPPPAALAEKSTSSKDDKPV
jgi:sec-independent protein translocase protein TatA